MKPSDYIRKGWCQHVLAKDSSDHTVEPYNPDAVMWCLAGAIIAAYPESALRREAIYAQNEGLVRGDIVDWNDSPGRNQADVIQLLESIGE